MADETTPISQEPLSVEPPATPSIPPAAPSPISEVVPAAALSAHNAEVPLPPTDNNQSVAVPVAPPPINEPSMSPSTVKHKSTLGTTLIISLIVLSIGLIAWYWSNNQSSSPEPSGTTSSQPVTSSTTTPETVSTTTISATPVSTGVTATDLTNEVKSIDTSLAALPATDFNESVLSDSNVGL